MRHLLSTAQPIAEDLAGTIVFYGIYLLTGSPALGLGIGLATGFAQMARHRWRREPIPTVLLLGVLLTILFGGVSWAIHDVRVILLKPSLIYVCVGIAMLPRGWVRRYVPTIALELLPARTFDRVGWGWAALMFATAAGNVVLVATLPPRTATGWLAAVAAASKLLLFATQYAVLRPRAERNYWARPTDDRPDLGL